MTDILQYKCLGHRCKDSKKNNKLPITLNKFKRREKYVQLKSETRYCIVKWGQRKLLLTCLQFLNIAVRKYKEKYDKEELLVLYVGAGDGTNIYVLSKMFPKLKFDLFDDHFDEKLLRQRKNIHLFIRYFTHEDAENYKSKGKNLIFISDIRTTYDKEGEPSNFDVYDNSLKQLDWIYTIKPLLSHLKFRCLFNTEIFKIKDYAYDLHKKLYNDGLSKTEIEKLFPNELTYNVGKIFLQPWTGPTSSEARLFIKRKDLGKMKKYDSVDYENAMFALNQVRQQEHFEKTIDNLCDCFDCNLEYHIIRKYLKLMKLPINKANDFSIYFNYILRVPYKSFKLKNKNNFDIKGLMMQPHKQLKDLNKIQHKFIHLFIVGHEKYKDTDFIKLFENIL
jgi:hypothetical protein